MTPEQQSLELPTCPGCGFAEVDSGETWCQDCELPVEWITFIPLSGLEAANKRVAELEELLRWMVALGFEADDALPKTSVGGMR